MWKWKSDDSKREKNKQWVGCLVLRQQLQLSLSGGGALRPGGFVNSPVWFLFGGKLDFSKRVSYLSRKVSRICVCVKLCVCCRRISPAVTRRRFPRNLLPQVLSAVFLLHQPLIDDQHRILQSVEPRTREIDTSLLFNSTLKLGNFFVKISFQSVDAFILRCLFSGASQFVCERSGGGALSSECLKLDFSKKFSHLSRLVLRICEAHPCVQGV